MKYHRVNRNSLSQFMRTRAALLHVSVDIASYMGKDGLVHYYEARPGRTYASSPRGNRAAKRAKFGSGKSMRRSQKAARRFAAELF